MRQVSNGSRCNGSKRRREFRCARTHSARGKAPKPRPRPRRRRRRRRARPSRPRGPPWPRGSPRTSSAATARHQANTRTRTCQDLATRRARVPRSATGQSSPHRRRNRRGRRRATRGATSAAQTMEPTGAFSRCSNGEAALAAVRRWPRFDRGLGVPGRSPSTHSPCARRCPCRRPAAARAAACPGRGRRAFGRGRGSRPACAHPPSAPAASSQKSSSAGLRPCCR